MKQIEKPCPTCYALMRMTDAGWACDRHGVVQPKPPARQTTRTAPPPVQTVDEMVVRPRVVTTPRPSNQQQKLAEYRDEIVRRNQGGESLTSIGADLWEELGYKNEHVAASKIGMFLKRHKVELAPNPPGPTPGTRAESRFTEERLVELRAAMEAGVPVWEFAGTHWETWGFRSRIAADSCLRKWLRTKPV